MLDTEVLEGLLERGFTDFLVRHVRFDVIRNIALLPELIERLGIHMRGFDRVKNRAKYFSVYRGRIYQRPVYVECKHTVNVRLPSRRGARSHGGVCNASQVSAMLDRRSLFDSIAQRTAVTWGCAHALQMVSSTPMNGLIWFCAVGA